MMRRLLILLPLCLLPLGLTGCASVKAKLPFLFPPRRPTPIPPAPPAPPPVYRTRDGLKITPVDIPQDENARILGIDKWHFKITPPPLTKYFAHRVEWHEYGKAPRRLTAAAQSINNLDPIDLVVALQPIDDSASRGKKMRLYVGDKSGGGTSIIDNPMRQKGSDITRGYSYAQTFKTDGSCVLLEVGNSTPNPRNPTLVVRFKAIKGDAGMDTFWSKP